MRCQKSIVAVTSKYRLIKGYDPSSLAPAGPGRRGGPVGRTTATTPHRFAALVTTTVLGSLAGESVGYLLGRRYGLRLRAGRLGRRLGEDRWVAAEAFLAGLAVVAAALAVVLTVQAARSHAQRRQGGAPPSSRVQPLEPLTVDPLGGGRHERHDTAA